MSTHVAVLPKGGSYTINFIISFDTTAAPPHSHVGLPALFILHESSLLEVHAIAPDAPRSWFVGQTVVSDGKLLLMTPIDPVFLLIPFIRALLATEPQPPFKPTDDLLEEAAARYSQLDIKQADIASFMGLDCVRQALRQISETKDVPPDLAVHRPSNECIIAFIKRRIERVAAVQQFPGLADQTESAPDIVGPVDRTPASGSTCPPAQPTSDSNSPGPSFATLQRQHLRLGLSVVELGPLDCPNAQAIRAAARIKIASEIIGVWVEEKLLEEVLQTYDISAYTTYAALRAEQARAELAAATAQAEAAEAGKPGKGKSGEKRKAGAQASRGVEKLKKANTTGMSLLTTFFGKKS
ncbi:hypothetical protein CTheo_7420 [Ceratobasidium theobromae]|uniref:Ribonuclease H2 subunit B n=1 Tax=Ceratobasidium theobromae TaxID=1582974 RepID=A0A5N5QBL1_9AGAM|nr:hypothetical protein CTheo_7420 [Ceratobasidium theobromae]